MQSVSSEDSVILEDVSTDEIPFDLIDNFEDILDDSQPNFLAEDSQSISDLFNESYIEMDKKFIDFLKVYTESTKNGESVKTKLKIWFFAIIMFVIIVLIGTQAAVCIVAVVRSSNNDKALVAICGIMIENITAILVLPRIIAEYLFNKKEETNRIKIIRSMQKYNDHKNKR